MRESVTYQEILAEGKAEGKAEAMRQVAFNLLREGMAIEQVAKVTELSIEEVEVLHRQINPQTGGK